MGQRHALRRLDARIGPGSRKGGVRAPELGRPPVTPGWSRALWSVCPTRHLALRLSAGGGVVRGRGVREWSAAAAASSLRQGENRWRRERTGAKPEPVRR